MNAPIAASRLVIPFPTDAVLIGGDWRAADGGATLGLEDPSDGSDLARIARGGAADIDAAVAAARAALDGAWGRMSALERGRILSAIGSKVLDNVELLARARGARRRQAAQAGARRCRRARPLLRVLRRLLRQGARRDPAVRRRLHRADAARAARRHRPHRALELSDADRRPQRRRRPGDGQCLRPQAGRGGLPDGARVRPDRDRGRPAAGRAQRRARARRGGGRGAVGASGHRPPVVHRLGRHRRAGADGGGGERGAGHARARRQEPADRLRRRRPRCGAALPRQRRHPERRPDLLGGLAHPGRAAAVRGGAHAHGRALPGAARRPGGAATSTSAR